MNDLKSKYDFSGLEMDWDENSTTFVFHDISNDTLSFKKMETSVYKINEYLINKYPSIDSSKIKNYLFSGEGGFEIIQFTIDQKGKLINKKKY